MKHSNISFSLRAWKDSNCLKSYAAATRDNKFDAKHMFISSGKERAWQGETGGPHSNMCQWQK